LPLKPHEDLRLVGQDVVALDIDTKTTGQAIYGIDAEVDGMVFGVPMIPPTRYGSSVLSVDDSAAQGMAGYLQTLTLDDPSGSVPGWVGVLGDSLMAAQRAAENISVEWQVGERGSVTEDDKNADCYAHLRALEHVG